MPVTKPRETVAPDEFEDLRATLARRLAWFWSHDPDDEVPDEVRAWLDEASDQRAANLIVGRRLSERERAARGRRKQQEPEGTFEERTSAPLIDALTRITDRGAAAHVTLVAMVVRRFADADLPELEPFVAAARRLLRRIVERARYEDTAEIAFALADGKANAPQTVAALALNEMGWSTGRIAATLPAGERVSGAVDKAQVRRLVRKRR